MTPASTPEPVVADEWRPDTPRALGGQGARLVVGRMRVRGRIMFRSLFMAGQIVTVLVIGQVLGYRVPYLTCFTLIAIGALINAAVAVSLALDREPLWWSLSTQLAFDILQYSALLFVAGGAGNPFLLLLIVPATVAGANLPARPAILLTILAMVCALFVSAWSTPLAGPTGQVAALTPAVRLGSAFAMAFCLAWTGGYTAWVTRQAQRMALALQVAETVLSREQRMSALGGLAAAAAHELGTPLATITVVAKELAREAPEGPLRTDALLLIEQAQRCRDILKRLAERPETDDAVHERMSPLQFLREVLAPYAGKAEVRAEAVVSGPPGMPAPDLWRRPEVLHAVTAFVENAYDFAAAEILVNLRFDADAITVEVRDDGPGFPPAVMARLGEPYATSRPGAEGSRTGHVGMGLGVFIAKTLLERTGATVGFKNAKGHGAIVSVRWPRARMEALEPHFEGLELTSKFAT